MVAASLQTNPLLWEAQHAAAVKKAIPSVIPPNATLREVYPPGLDFYAQSDQFIATFRDTHERLRILQTDLINYVDYKHPILAFSAGWLGTTVKEREKHYFNAMRVICSIPEMEDIRIWCPEITLEAFAKRDGAAYITLLKTLSKVDLPEDQYISVENATLNRILQLPANFRTTVEIPKNAKRAFGAHIILRRMLFITLSVWHTMLSFHGESGEVKLFKLVTEGSRHTELPKDLLADSIYEVLRAEAQQMRKDAPWICAKCKVLESKAGPTFLCCSKCNSIGRKVKYCSKECQIADWKSSSPPHKELCGKPLKDVAFTPNMSATSTQFHVHPSPALKEQIKLLEANPAVDYVYLTPGTQPNAEMTLPITDMKIRFRTIRKKAFATGDAYIVGQLFKALKLGLPRVADLGYTQFELIQQLKREYGVDPTRAPAKPSQPLPLVNQDLVEALKELGMTSPAALLAAFAKGEQLYG